jgi:hypothetical protein
MKLKKVLKTKEEEPNKPQPCRAYRDQEGRPRYHGTAKLKQTEWDP